MLRFVATIITLSFLFTLSVTSATACADDGYSQHVSQTHAVQPLPMSSAEAPVIEEESEVDHLLIVSYVIGVLTMPNQRRVHDPSYDYVAHSRRSVPLYVAAQQFLL